jgi:hypothetical protein
MPEVILRASFTVSILRSSSSFSVTTVTDWGMSRSCCLPLPMRVVVVRRLSLPWGSASAAAFTTTGLSVLVSSSASLAGDWAQPLIEAANISAPRGNMARSAEITGCAAWGRGADGCRRRFFLCAKGGLRR